MRMRINLTLVGFQLFVWLVMVRNKMEVFHFAFLISLVTSKRNGSVHNVERSNLEECTRDYSETEGAHFAFTGTDEEIKAPWLAAIGIISPNEQFTVICSGSILTRRFILSAAHCFIVEAYKPSHLRVGANNIDSRYAKQREIFDVNLHPDYNSDTKTFYFDIAIVSVKEEIQYSSRISPICLPDSSSLHPGSGLGISVQGWGKTERGWKKDVSQVTVIVRSKESFPHIYCSMLDFGLFWTLDL